MDLFYHFTPDFDGFWFFAVCLVCGKKKIEGRPKLKVGGACFWVLTYR
jgi:hypothetical protein